MIGIESEEKIMNKIFKSKALWTFVGGMATALVGAKFAKSDKARELAVHSMASTMKMKDDAMATFESLKEDAQDIYHEAKAKNNGEQ